MIHRVALAGLLLLGGCDLIDQGRDLIGDLTNPLVTQALVLGVAPPSEASDIDLPPEYAEGAGATVFLADAADVADLENAPITGADVSIRSVAVAEVGAGGYALEPGDIAYAPNETWELQVTLSGDSATAGIALPPPADFTVPAAHTVNSGLTVDLTGQDFDGAFVVVVDDGGNIVYDNRPTDIKGLYDLTRGEAAGVIEIPATAFPQVGGYLVGVAGIRTTTGREDLDGMNTVLSTMMAGQLVFEPLAAAP